MIGSGTYYVWKKLCVLAEEKPKVKESEIFEIKVSKVNKKV